MAYGDNRLDSNVPIPIYKALHVSVVSSRKTYVWVFVQLLNGLYLFFCVPNRSYPFTPPAMKCDSFMFYNTKQWSIFRLEPSLSSRNPFVLFCFLKYLFCPLLLFCAFG